MFSVHSSCHNVLIKKVLKVNDLFRYTIISFYYWYTTHQEYICNMLCMIPYIISPKLYIHLSHFSWSLNHNLCTTNVIQRSNIDNITYIDVYIYIYICDLTSSIFSHQNILHEVYLPPWWFIKNRIYSHE